MRQVGVHVEQQSATLQDEVAVQRVPMVFLGNQHKTGRPIFLGHDAIRRKPSSGTLSESKFAQFVIIQKNP